MDRIDLHVEVTPVSYDNLTNSLKGEESMHIRDRVIQARDNQIEHFTSNDIYSNAQMSSNRVKLQCELTTADMNLLNTSIEKLGLSARAYDRILKVSRTIADLAGSSEIKNEHLTEAIQFRSLDRENWAV